MIDCDKCYDEGCLSLYEGQEQDNGMEDAANWIAELAQCKQVENYMYNGYLEQYAGLICNADGNGIEIGVFLDADCLCPL